MDENLSGQKQVIYYFAVNLIYEFWRCSYSLVKVGLLVLVAIMKLAPVLAYWWLCVRVTKKPLYCRTYNIDLRATAVLAASLTTKDFMTDD